MQDCRVGTSKLPMLVNSQATFICAGLQGNGSHPVSLLCGGLGER